MFSYFEPVKRAKDESGMTGFRSFDNGMCERVLDLLEAGYLRLKKVVVESITVIEFGVNDCGGSGGGCFGIEVSDNAAELTNMITAGFVQR